MGSKYTIYFMRNGTCGYQFDRITNSLFRALWYLFTLSLKYPIVDFQIRRGYIPCDKCTTDWCGRSRVWKSAEVLAKENNESLL